MQKLGIVATIILLFVAIAWLTDMMIAVIAVIVTIAGLTIFSGIALFLFMVFDKLEDLRLKRAERICKEKESSTKVVVAGSQVFIRDTDHNANWRAAHLDPRFYANGQYSDPTESEIRAWQAFNSPRVIKEQAAAMLPAQTQIDLLAALDPVQRCLIVGASDTGKTTLLQWLVSRRLNTSQVIVIDPHAYPHKWPNEAHVTGTGRNYLEIDRALTALVQLMTKRYDEIGRGVVAEMAHSRITILIDEWRAITGNLGSSASDAIKALLTESRKAAFSVFVASHSDRAKPLGLMGEYDLKDGFCVVRLSVVDGQRTATIDTGNGLMPAVLPGPFAGSQPQVIEHISLKPEPNKREAHILDLHDRGASKTKIAKTVFGKKGGFQNRAVQEVLMRFGRV